ncbi:23S rRNA (uracil(1939)-C(5))-methyltransferase RlmD [Erysipelotrichaceae bacterium OttesenSCG-928-M19]|nr:23S rRNA (uracil(1939)-C(5))-methyltransferase RlmD [Erysipelotrichaceae bacterium OttesenSCG-928-M19]
MKNKVINAQVVDYTHDGKGIVKYDGAALFVPNCLIDEKLEVKIVKWKKKYGYGKVIKLLSENKNRVQPSCPFYFQCGGCQLQIMNYQEQLNFKNSKIKNVFLKHNITFTNLNIIENKTPLAYRNKLSIPLTTKKGTISAGLYRENSNDIIVIDNCLIQQDSINIVLNEIVSLLNAYNINIYDKFNQQGYLRQIVIRSTYNQDSILIGFVINEIEYHDELKQVIEQLVKNNKKIKTIVINYNNKNTNVILGDNSKVIYGDGYLIDEVNNYLFQISLNSFYQVNALQMNNLYLKAIEMAKLSSEDIVLDAYCGVGTISIYLASKVKKVIGIDIVAQAINDANENKKLNKINNIDFICEDISEYFNHDHTSYDCLFVDPPRKGCSLVFLNDIIKKQPKKIIYIACDPATQARDIRYLIDNGYQIIEQCAVDMFSQTYHIENIISLQLIN